MGYQMAVDANVFLLADTNAGCAAISQRVLYDRNHMLVLDKNNKIRNEYRKYSMKYGESRLRQLVKALIERAPANPQAHPDHYIYFIELISQMTVDEYGLCKETDSAEPDYFGVTIHQPHTYFVIPDLLPNEKEKIIRGYRDGLTVDDLQKRFPDVKLRTTGNLNWLDDPGDCAPRSLDALRAFIKENKFGETHPERAFIELKCPEDPEDGVTNTIYRKAMEAVCAFTNTMNGYIFIGVRDNGDIPGIVCKYEKRHQESWDRLWQIVGSRMGSDFPPYKKPIVCAWWIPVSSDKNRCVLALRVSHQTGRPVTFLGNKYPEIYLREGTTSLKQAV